MTFLETAEIFEKIENTAGRNDMTAILVDSFGKLSSEESQIFTYLLDGRVAPYFIDAEYSFSEKSVVNCLNNNAKSLNIDFDAGEVRKVTGDIGETASLFVQKMFEKHDQKFGINDIYDILWSIVNTTGTGSVLKKSEIFLNALKRMQPIEAKFFARIVVGKLRLGASVKTILDAISMLVLGSKELRELLDTAYGFTSDSGYLVAFMGKLKGKSLEEIQKELEIIKPIPGVPIYPRLVERVESFEEGFKRMEGLPYILQPKYDGLRCQIHIGVDYNRKELKDRVWSGKLTVIEENNTEFDMFSSSDTLVVQGNDVKLKVVKLYTRNLEELTDMFPEIVEYAQSLNCESAILDSELVGIDYSKKTFIPFQDTMSRRRKYDIQGKSEDLPVKAFVFDVIAINGQDLSRESLDVRCKAIISTLESESPVFDNPSDLFNYVLLQSEIDFFDKQKLVVLAPDNYISTQEEQQVLFDKYVKMGFEGVVIKQVEAKYLPGVRNFEWIKLKKSMTAGNVDSFDLVILGYYSGSGKQTEFGMGALLAGVFNKSTGLYEPVTKIGTGITQEQWREIKIILDEITLRDEELVDANGIKMPKSVAFAGFELPDKWVYPKIVVQTDADEISRSQSYDAGKDVLGFGLALRFPRLMEFNRDKSPEDATSTQELVDMYKMRKDAISN